MLHPAVRKGNGDDGGIDDGESDRRKRGVKGFDGPCYMTESSSRAARESMTCNLVGEY